MPAKASPLAWYGGESQILKFRFDAERERGWVLTREGVISFDYRTRQSTGTIPLPEWIWAEEAFSCLPDLAIGASGEAIVTSNVLPTLWRIDPANFSVAMQQPALDAEADRDVGFTGLVYSAEQQSFFGASSTGSLWRIDPQLRGARKVALSGPILGACGVTTRKTVNRFFGLCIQGERQDWTINLAPDRQSAYLIDRPCTPEAVALKPDQVAKALPVSWVGR